MDAHYLQPFGPGSIGLRIVRIDPQIPGAPTPAKVVLGRNTLTGLDTSSNIYSLNVSRAHAEISIVEGEIFIAATTSQENTVFRNQLSIVRNAAMALVPGDQISLLGPVQHFNYTLVRGTMTDDMIEACHIASYALTEKTPRKRKATELAPRIDNEENTAGLDSALDAATQPADTLELDASSSSSSCGISHKATAKLEEHYMCSICCDSMACCHSLSPCGDVFCYACIADWFKKSKVCPLCSGDFVLKSAVPNRTLDGIIREILALDSDPNILEEWEDRVLQGVHRKAGVKHVPLKKIVPVILPVVVRIAAPIINVPPPPPVNVRNVLPLPPAVTPAVGGGLIDLTFDDSVRNAPAAAPRTETVRSVEVQNGRGIEKFRCQCGAFIKPKHVRIVVSVDDTALGPRQLLYHMWCISSAGFRAHKILFPNIRGIGNLTKADCDQLKLSYDLVE